MIPFDGEAIKKKWKFSAKPLYLLVFYNLVIWAGIKTMVLP